MKLKYAVKIAAIKASYTQLGVTTQPSASVTAGIFQAQRLAAGIQTLNRILADAEQGNFFAFVDYNLTDGARPSDQMVFELFRYLADDSYTADLYIAQFNKIVGEAVAVSDIETVAVGKSFEDTPLFLEAHRYDFGKTPADSPSVADAIDTFATAKQLYDSVFATDDVDGQASILDDQEMQFVKQRTDVTFIGDSIYLQRDYLRDFLETAAAADVIKVLTSKHVSDTFSASETLTKAVSAARIDSALLGDAHAAASAKVLFDTPLLADAGSLRSQGYSDFTYFGEDYVGSSRTFT